MRTIITCVYGVLMLVAGMFVEATETVWPSLVLFFALVTAISLGACTAWLDDNYSDD